MSPFARATLIILLGTAGGCGGSTVERSLSVERLAPNPCTATLAGELRPANVFVLELLRLTGVAAGVETSDSLCELCLDGDSRAPCLLEQRRCHCTEPVPVEVESIAEQLRGLSFDGLDAGTYCFRLVLHELPDVSPDTECPCDSTGIRATATRGCAVSPPVDVTASPESDPVVLPLYCRDDLARQKQRCTRQDT